jgi:hypothetical protein
MRVHLQQYPLLYQQLQHYQHLFLDNNTILIKLPPLEWEKLHQKWLSQELPHPLSQLQGASSISWTLGTSAVKLRINYQPGGLTFLPLQLRPIKLHVALETFLTQDSWFLKTFGTFPVLRQAARTGQGIMSVLSLQLPLSRTTNNDHWLAQLGALYTHPGGATFVLELEQPNFTLASVLPFSTSEETVSEHRQNLSSLSCAKPQVYKVQKKLRPLQFLPFFDTASDYAAKQRAKEVADALAPYSCTKILALPFNSVSSLPNIALYSSTCAEPL